eukprot:TRINITY_DN30553_c0_g1_i1.p1 TRINITY_DN30553_c0_g1~~TRINITY_DN30553_c0_g1_i1.p1  ORF type:complete len:366 (+),score=23.94 TRINITY_DN30553_c0_g1_i1:87-1184(+)
MITTMQEARNRIDALEKEVDELRTRNRQLQQEVAQNRALRTQLSEQLTRTNSIQEEEKPEPLSSLGPFAIIPKVEIVLELIPGSDAFTVSGPATVVNFFESLDVPLFGSLSPRSPVTLGRQAREAANIPLQATEFAFAYPIAGMGQLSAVAVKRINKEDPRHSFLALGGFVYFDASGTRLLQINGLAAGKGLYFSPPRPLPHDVCNVLLQQGRLQPVTVQAIQQTGAESFAWLTPGEQFDGCKDLPEPVPHGAFAYMYENTADSRYFICSTELPDEHKPEDSLHITPLSMLSQRAYRETVTPRAGSKPAEDAPTCVICLTELPKVLLQPCSHLCLCSGCADSQIKQSRQCPVCRRKVTKMVGVFM